MYKYIILKSTINWNKNQSGRGANLEKNCIRKVSWVQDQTPGAAGGDLPEAAFACHLSSADTPVSCWSSAWGSELHLRGLMKTDFHSWGTLK